MAKAKNLIDIVGKKKIEEKMKGKEMETLYLVKYFRKFL